MPEQHENVPQGFGATLRILAPQSIVQAFFMLVYAIWWLFAWPGEGTVAFGVAVLYALVVVFLSVGNIRHSLQFRNDATDELKRTSRQLGTLMGVTYGLVWLAAIVLALTGQAKWILPVVTTLIALHFFPLARILDRKIDYLLAPIALLFALYGLWLAGQSHVDWQAVYGITGIGGALATGIYAAYILRGYRQLARSVTH